MIGKSDPIAVVEAAYSREGSDLDWLRSVAELLRPELDRGEGLLAYFYDTALPARDWWTREHIKLDLSPGFAELWAHMGEVLQQTPAEFVNALHTSAPLYGDSHTTAQAMALTPDQAAAFEAVYRPFGFETAVALSTSDGSGRGLVVNSQSRRSERVGRQAQALWSRVSAHLAAGLRLRRAAREAPEAVEPEAVLSPSGRVEDARGEAVPRAARDLLREAVLRQEKARGRARRDDSLRALELWRGLEHGRWSLVDHYERGGRRYLVAVKNAVGVSDPRALSARERQIARLVALGHTNKLIAYELGLSTSTVASHLASALKKLGLRGRLDLIRLRP